jgi:zinc transporter ZupT
MRSLLLLSAFVASPLRALAEAGHEEDGHWAWAGLFELSATNKYTWTFAKESSGAYPEGTTEVEFLIVATDEADSHGLEEAEEEAEAIWGSTTAAEVAPNGAVPIGTWAHMELDQDSWVTQFKISVPTAGPYVVFANHPPIEFENGFHYLKDQQGNDIEPVVEEAGEHGDHDDHDDDVAAAVDTGNWGLGTVILGSILIALPSLVLIAALGPVINKGQDLPWKSTLYSVLYSLSSGALLGCAVFLLLGEGLHLASVGKGEVDGVWTWGVAILFGWIFCVVIHQVCHVLFPREHQAPCIEIEAKGPGVSAEVTAWQANEEGKSDGGELSEIKVDAAVAAPVIFGDFWHNLVDGMIVGFSAKTCGGSMTWTIVAVTILHEVPQELADFVILVTKANMKWYWAALLNFASGLSTVLGAVLAYETEMSVNFQGLGLAFGGGVYMYVAMTELAPNILAKASAQEYAMRIAAFALGAASIGLVLLGHEHCSAPSAPGVVDAHAGHGH